MNVAQKVCVFLYPGCAEFEITVACWQIAESENYEILTIAYEKTPISTNSGLTMIPDKLISEIENTNNLAGIIIPGGSLLDLRQDFQSLLQKLDEENKLLAAICAGPQYFAVSNILDARPFTTSRTAEKYFELNQPDPFDWDYYKETRVVMDKNLITAKGYAFSDFAIAIWEYLGIINSDVEREDWRWQFFPQNLK